MRDLHHISQGYKRSMELFDPPPKKESVKFEILSKSLKKPLFVKKFYSVCTLFNFVVIFYKKIGELAQFLTKMSTVPFFNLFCKTFYKIKK